MTPVVVTPNDSKTLRELCTKADSAISSLDEQVSMLVAKTVMQKERQEQLETDLLQDAQQVSEQGDQIKETEARIQQAMVAAGLALGTLAEASTAANVTRLQAELTELMSTHEEREKQHKKLVHDTRKGQHALQLEIDKDETDLAALRENRRMLVQTHQEHHDLLGEALYNEVASAVKDMRETAERLEVSLDETTSETAQYYLRIPVLLGEWPALARRAVSDLLPQKDPAPLPVKVVSDALLAYLDALEQYGTELKVTAWTNIQGIASLLSIPHEFTRQITSPTGLGLNMKQSLQQRRAQIEDYRRQVEQETKSYRW